MVGADNAYGVADRAEAIEVLSGLPAHSVRKIYFIGHGTQGGYFFNGRPDPAQDFVADRSQCLHANPLDAEFVAALAQALDDRDSVELAFLSCYTAGRRDGRTDLFEALSPALTAARGTHNHLIGGFTDYYDVNFTVGREGQITRFRDRITSSSTSRATFRRSTNANGTPTYQRAVRGH